MNAKSWLPHFSMHEPLRTGIKTRLQDRRERRVWNGLGGASYPQGILIRDVLRQLKQDLSPADQDWITKIEAQRKELMGRNEPLVDGSLGAAGLYDGDVTVRQACRVSKQPKPGLMLYLLTRALKPRTVIELGTNVGISSSFIGAALKVNNQGTLTTLDSSPYRQKLAREVHQALSLDNITYVQGLFTDTLNDTLAELARIDLAFIDGHHQYKPTLEYFEQILALSSSDAVFVFDDIRWSDGMKRAWSEIQADSRLGIIVDLHSVGICVRAEAGVARRYMFPPLHRALR